jgi:hypothetical protein
VELVKVEICIFTFLKKVFDRNAEEGVEGRSACEGAIVDRLPPWKKRGWSKKRG